MAQLTTQQFGELFSIFQRSALRIETLDQYLVAGERERFESYLRGTLAPPDENEEWAGTIRDIVASGKRIARVHVVSRDITPYVRFEAEWYYKFNARAGEDIRILYRDQVPSGLTLTDTWLFDESVVIDMNYTEEGELLHVSRDDDPERAVQAFATWEAVSSLSISLGDFHSDLRKAPIRLDGG